MPRWRAEDSRFFSHNGIDPLRMGRAAFDALTKRRFVSGGFDHYTANCEALFQPRPRSFRTKFIEIFTARKLEMFADKKSILTAYLNRLLTETNTPEPVPRRSGYFGKPMNDLSAAEASLAGRPSQQAIPAQSVEKSGRRSTPAGMDPGAHD